MILKADVLSVSAIADLKLELATSETAMGEVLLRLVLGADEDAYLKLGGRYALDGNLADRLQEVEGLANVSLEPLRDRVKLKRVA